jgi:hypothetical protein
LLKAVSSQNILNAKLDSLTIYPYQYFSEDSDKQKLLELVSSINIKRLKLVWLNLNDSDYNILSQLKKIEYLDIEIPQSKSLDTIKSLLAQLCTLKTLELRKLPRQIINLNAIPAQFLPAKDLKALPKAFPAVHIIHNQK